MGNSKILSLYATTFVVVVALLFPGVAHGYVAAEYETNETFPSGAVVAIGNNGEVVRASSGAKNYLGVVTGQVDSQVEVASSGIVSLLVTDEHGSIKKGDKVGISDLAGIAAKWQPGRVLVGITKGSFENWKEIESRTAAGETRTVRVASIEVQLMNDASGSTQPNPYIATVQAVAEGITGRSVDVWRALTAMFIGLGGLILSFGLLFISSRESFFAIGRNPIASRMIVRSLWKMVAISVAVMCTSLAVAYMIVRAG